MNKILVTGASGQLGSELKAIMNAHEFEFVFTDVQELDLTNPDAVQNFFEIENFRYCINCAAYTAVDKAETDATMAEKINAEAVEHLAKACFTHNVVLVHISTDFVFDGHNYKPYTEKDVCNPISAYGRTKRAGELMAMHYNPYSIIIRTSWLYSTYGSNFVKTMLRLADEKNELGIITDQIGSPTNASDLASSIMKIITEIDHRELLSGEVCGIYHYSNEGVASWYDFAMAIFEMKQKTIKVKPIKTTEYPTPAARPHYSVMDKSKIKRVFGIEIDHWRTSLQKCLDKL